MTPRRITIRALALVAAGLVFLLAAGPAAASTQVATFDDLSAGTFVSDQYATPQAVEFHNTSGPFGSPDGFLPHVDSAPSQAHSKPNVADISTCPGGCGEFAYEPHTRGYLLTYASSISVYVGNLPSSSFPSGNTATVDLTAYDANGTPVAPTATATVTEGAPFTQLTATSTSGQGDIAYFDIAAPAGADVAKPIALDDLTITRPSTPPPPNFTLGTTLTGASMIAGGTINFPVDIHRANGSSGNVSFGVTGLPSGVTASFSPNPASGTGVSTTLTLTSTVEAPTSDSTVTVTGTPGSGAGSSPRTLRIQVHVTANCDLFAGTSYILAQTDRCMTRVNGVEEAFNEPVRLDGLLLEPLTTTGSGSELLIDTVNRKITSVGSWRVSVQGLPDVGLYEGSINWNLGANTGAPITVVDADNKVSNVLLQGLPVGHTKITLTPDAHSHLSETLKLGFWPFDYFGSLTATPTFDSDNHNGANFGGLEIKFDKVVALGLGLKDVDIRWVSTNTWSGRATVSLPFTPPFEIGAGIGLKDGGLDFLAGSVNGLNVPIGAGIFLQKIGFEAGVSPPALSGTMGLSAGPSIEGKTAVTFDGTLKVTLSDPWVVEVDGSAKVAGTFELGEAFARYSSNGLFELGGKAKWDLGVGSISGQISGWLQDASAFDIEGSVKGCINAWITDVCAGANALVSSVGIAACVDLTVVSGGIGYYWGGSFDLFGGSCDLSPWRAMMSAVTAASGPRRFTLPAGLPSAVFAVDGVGGAPAVTITSPQGKSVSVSTVKPFVRSGNVLGAVGTNGTTYIAIKKPAGGPWLLTNTGSVPIRRVREARGLPPPSVRASVTGRGYTRTLRWHLNPLPGQKVRFAEVGRDVRRSIAATAAGTGQVHFHPAAGPAGRRRILALVLQNGLPRRSLVVASYIAPGPQRPARPRHVRIARHGTRLTISWRAPKQGFRSAVYVIVGDGRRLLLIEPASTRSVTIRSVAARYGATAVVAGLTAADGRGPAATASIKPHR